MDSRAFLKLMFPRKESEASLAGWCPMPERLKETRGMKKGKIQNKPHKTPQSWGVGWAVLMGKEAGLLLGTHV